MAIYLVQNTENRSVKIGYTENVKRRLCDLKSMTGVKLELIMVIQGNHNKEQKIHKMLSWFCKQGEWFREEVIDIINQCVDEFDELDMNKLSVVSQERTDFELNAICSIQKDGYWINWDVFYTNHLHELHQIDFSDIHAMDVLEKIMKNELTSRKRQNNLLNSLLDKGIDLTDIGKLVIARRVMFDNYLSELLEAILSKHNRLSSI